MILVGYLQGFKFVLKKEYVWLRTGTNYTIQLQSLADTVRISGHIRNGHFTDMLATNSFPKFTVQQGDAGVPVLIYMRNSLVPISNGTSAWGSAVTHGLSTQVPEGCISTRLYQLTVGRVAQLV